MKKTSRIFASVIASAVLAMATAVRADVTAGSLFTDHTVLQQGMATPVWGVANAGEKVTVALNGQSQNTVAGADGKWMVRLNSLKAGGPYDLTISGSNTITLKDVYVGEVWLCSGQSNMDFTLAKTTKYYFAGANNEAEEVAAANYPQIRMFSGEWTKSYTPQSTIKGEWKICNPENVKEFSAIGYFFARDLQKEIHVPIGIVTMTFGASTAQSWIRREAIAANPELAPMLTPFDKLVADFKAMPPAPPAPPAPAAPAVAAAVAAASASAATTGPASTQRARRAAPRGPRDPVQDQHNPTVMYNGMIAPMIPYGIKGVLWYQGESITGDHKLFPVMNETLIKDWRTLWNQPDLPFYFCQLAALKNNSNSPTVRELQAQALSIPHTAMAVTIDIGDPANVHPKDKQDVGDRLTRIALANVYGRDIEFSGPMYRAMSVEGDSIKLTFTHAKSLMAKGGDLKTFVIAGADGKFIPGTAKIDGNTVVVSSSEVKDPKTVRYAWDNYPEGCNLYNEAGLPAAPFRTDRD